MATSLATRRRLWGVRALGVVLGLVGLALAIGGVRLATLNGSWYYLIAGAATFVAGINLFRLKATGAALFLVVVTATVFWALYEVGTSFWGLVPRLAPMLVLGLGAALALGSLRPTARMAMRSLALMQGLVLMAGLVSMFLPHSVIINTAATAGAIVNRVPVITDAKSTENRWTQFGRTDKSDRFAPFDQINAGNVDKLEVAWTYRTGAATGFPNEDANTPTQVGDTVYLCTPESKVIALNAETGAEKWKFDSGTKQTPHWNRCRGVGYYEVPAAERSGNGECDARVILADKQARLWAIDAKTGKSCSGFGDSGKGYADLSVGMGEYKAFYYMQTSQPLVVDGRAIIGGWVWDGKELNEPSGVIRAYNLKDGSLDWAWDLGNPDTTKLPPDGQTYTKGTPNWWSHGAYDEKLGLIYLPLGNATPDFWAAHRTEAMNKYASSLVALNVKTGRVAWHFQTVHIDTWDYDVATPPTLVDAPDGKGGSTPALVLATKTHQLFLLDRATGKPLATVEERPAPTESVAGDVPAATTQPWSTGMPQLASAAMSEEGMWGATMFDQLYCRIRFKEMNYQGPYTKVTRKPTIIWPGYFGGFNWGGHAYDPRTNMLVVNDVNIPVISFLEPQATAEAKVAELNKNDYTKAGWKNSHTQVGTPYQTIRGAFNSFLGVPCNQPSWGNLTGIDLNTKQVAWQRPMGTVEDTELLGVRTGLPIPLGLPTLSGPIVTAGGVTFYVGTQDFYLRAFETSTGKELWKSRLPVGSQATPMTYLSPETGRQYLIVVAGGARQSPQRGDYVLAYALPK